MKKLLVIATFTTLIFSFGCGSKSGENKNSNASNKPSMDVNTMNPNVSNQGAANQNTNSNANVSSPTPTPANPDAMLHSDMQSAPNAATAPYDLQFLDTMTAHHQAAIVMAKSRDAKSAARPNCERSRKTL